MGKSNYQIRMNNASVNLDEVLVEGRKVLYELKQDRVVVNVSASPAFSGNNALQSPVLTTMCSSLHVT